jgi:hypothetical protein
MSTTTLNNLSKRRSCNTSCVMLCHKMCRGVEGRAEMSKKDTYSTPMLFLAISTWLFFDLRSRIAHTLHPSSQNLRPDYLRRALPLLALRQSVRGKTRSRSEGSWRSCDCVALSRELISLQGRSISKKNGGSKLVRVGFDPS